MSRALRGPALALVLIAITLLPRSTVSATRIVPAQAERSPLVRCHTWQLGASLVMTSGAMGHIAVMFRLRNRSARACSLFGYPGLQLVDGHGRDLPTHVNWARGYFLGDVPRRLVKLAPAANAYFAIEWSHIPTLNESCPVAQAVRIIPPNTYIPLRVRTRIDACGGRLTTSPVQARALSL